MPVVAPLEKEPLFYAHKPLPFVGATALGRPWIVGAVIGYRWSLLTPMSVIKPRATGVVAPTGNTAKAGGSGLLCSKVKGRDCEEKVAQRRNEGLSLQAHTNPHVANRATQNKRQGQDTPPRRGTGRGKSYNPSRRIISGMVTIESAVERNAPWLTISAFPPYWMARSTVRMAAGELERRTKMPSMTGSAIS